MSWTKITKAVDKEAGYGSTLWGSDPWGKWLESLWTKLTKATE